MVNLRILIGRLLLAVIIPAIGSGCVEEIPPLPLNEVPESPQKDSWWEDAFGSDQVAKVGAETLFLGGESEIRVRNPHRTIENVTEIVFADPKGNFVASWCSGRLGFASLVLPQMDDSGVRKEWRTIPMLDQSGRPLGRDALEVVKRALTGSSFLPQGQDAPVVHDVLDRFPATEVVGLMLVEKADREWSAERFRCFDAGNRFGSHSSHSVQCTGGVAGMAEMFTWHRAAMRLAWDLHAAGELESDPIPLKAGASFRRGGALFDLVGIETGEYRRSNGGREITPGDPATFHLVEGSAAVRTGFLAGTIPGHSIRRIEGRETGASWEELSFTPEEDGLITFEWPEDRNYSDLRVIWAPRILRVVFDLPGIGGGLPENEGVTTYNEVAFRLHESRISNGGIDWRVWQLTGRFPKIESERYQERRSRETAVDPGKLYRAGDLLTIWRELNPDLSIRWDEKHGSFVVKDR